MATASSATVRAQEIPEFPRAAAAYALKELARRAGVSADFYHTWRMETGAAGFVDVFVEPGSDKRIRFSRVAGILAADSRRGFSNRSSLVDAPSR